MSGIVVNSCYHHCWHSICSPPYEQLLKKRGAGSVLTVVVVDSAPSTLQVDAHSSDGSACHCLTVVTIVVVHIWDFLVHLYKQLLEELDILGEMYMDVKNNDVGKSEDGDYVKVETKQSCEKCQWCC